MRELKFDSSGLIPAVVQDACTGQVRMLGWMNASAIATTIESGFVTFFSRSRQELWRKGETSGNTLRLVEIRTDCDRDALLVRALPHGPTCHAGPESCFSWDLDKSDGPDLPPPGSFLDELEKTLKDRQSASGERSYTKRLLEGGAERIGAKLREEADELAVALDAENDERVADEAADLLYHLLVALRLRDVNLRSVMQVLMARTGQSGLEEKASRTT